MPVLSHEKLIIAFHKLSLFMAEQGTTFDQLLQNSSNYNAWFTTAEVERAVNALRNMLNNTDLEKWFADIKINPTPKKVGLILAGNIPLVGFHDVISVLATGNIALIKLSSSDNKLMPALLEELIKIEPLLADRIQYVERLQDFDAIIATGSNNTSRYFDYYFGKVPNIIRRNRNSVAVITGNETKQQIAALGHDIFDYFGLGCRNVSKIFIPENYDIAAFFEPLQDFQPIINHFKFNNNYDYNKSIYLVNMVPHFDNGFILLKEDEGLSSPLAVLYYQRYQQLDEVKEILEQQKDQIQCIVSAAEGLDNTLEFGQSQQPRLWDYADNVDTIKFLNAL
ncbi:acyl-CoA reductase [Pedobacter duraquae]|uniref:Acyl-CoA reductase LuxC n=1 Tax=Pedobacter duraquae TaxID=425511 RepID=A0A4V3C3Q4_9SPHI|nr:acyl-CoA reductase [Pedobacter duraquae]TDO22998.1 acyl-CoA reductase LuxC [Pedobacter duraquae]